jgi:sensor histidine kinase YesM
MATKEPYFPIKLFGRRDTINDIGIRVVLIPFFGISIPLITRMVPHSMLTNWQVKFSYAYTILIAFLIYEGSRFLLFSLRTYFDWFNKPARKILALVFAISFYCVPVSVLMLAGWYNIFLDGQINWPVLKLTTLIILVAVFFMVNLYETVFLVRDVANDKVKREQLERARAEAELEALKNQIDPHFIFNSLNTLSHLIEDKPEKARLFNDNLADVYRYILQNKARGLVLLREEISFLRNYFFLLQIRFDKAVQLETDVSEDAAAQYLVLPISLQLLLENAIKHNEFSEDQPLLVHIAMENDTLRVYNKVKKKIVRKPTSRIGLQNLKERYKLTTGREVIIEEGENEFIVYLPVLRIV